MNGAKGSHLRDDEFRPQERYCRLGEIPPCSDVSALFCPCGLLHPFFQLSFILKICYKNPDVLET